MSEVRPGDLKLKDQNGDKRIDQYDQVAMGYNATCPEIYYGFNLGAEYKGLGVLAQFREWPIIARCWIHEVCTDHC